MLTLLVSLHLSTNTVGGTSQRSLSSGAWREAPNSSALPLSIVTVATDGDADGKWTKPGVSSVLQHQRHGTAHLRSDANQRSGTARGLLVSGRQEIAAREVQMLGEGEGV